MQKTSNQKSSVAIFWASFESYELLLVFQTFYTIPLMLFTALTSYFHVSNGQYNPFLYFEGREKRLPTVTAVLRVLCVLRLRGHDLIWLWALGTFSEGRALCGMGPLAVSRVLGAQAINGPYGATSSSSHSVPGEYRTLYIHAVPLSVCSNYLEATGV